MKILKSICIFLLLLGLYFIPALLFSPDISYYKNLIKPTYAPNAYLFGIIWPILYALESLYFTLKIHNKTLSKEMIFYYILNYAISFFFSKVFFVDKNLFLSFAITFGCFISGLFIFITSFKTSKKEFILLVPYILWTLFASILMAHIYLLN